MKKGIHAALSVVLALGLLVPTAAAEESVADETSVTEAVTADAAEKQTNPEEAAAAEEGATESAAEASASDIRVQVNGKLIAFPDAQPYLDPVTNRTMVPVRFVSEALGATVTWDEQSKIVKFETPRIQVKKVGKEDQPYNLTFSLRIGVNSVDVVDRTFRLDAPAVIKEGRTFVPLRFVSETLGAKVEWNGQERTVVITEGVESVIWATSRPKHPESQAVIDQFAASVKVQGDKVTFTIPKLPAGYVFYLNYNNFKDAQYKQFNLQDKYKPGDAISIPHGGEGVLAYAIYKGSDVSNSVVIMIPTLDMEWGRER